jgi:uncharacterized protein (TIGR02246 family)
VAFACEPRTAIEQAPRRKAGSLAPLIEMRRHACDDTRGVHRLFEDAFNAGDIDGLMALYEPDAAVIPQPGSVVHGTEQVRAGLQAFLALQGHITLDTKLVVTVGDLAFLSNTWSLTGTGPDGKPLTMGATTAEVVRRQADGTWRYVIDNVWGDQGGFNRSSQHLAVRGCDGNAQASTG